jgi:1,2-phenylacetyl-CoA epoxidase PaaB subunit
MAQGSKSKVKFNSNDQIMMTTLEAACTSALLARSSASVSVWQCSEAHIAQLYPSYFKSKIKLKRPNNDDYIISGIYIGIVRQKQRECRGVTTK